MLKYFETMIIAHTTKVFVQTNQRPSLIYYRLKDFNTFLCTQKGTNKPISRPQLKYKCINSRRLKTSCSSYQ